MWILIVLTLVDGVGSKQALSEYPSKELCEIAARAVDPSDYEGHFLTACVPKPD